MATQQVSCLLIANGAPKDAIIAVNVSLEATVADLLEAVKIHQELSQTTRELTVWRCKAPKLRPKTSPDKLKQVIAELNLEDEEKAEFLAVTEVLAELDSFDPKTEALLICMQPRDIDSTSHTLSDFVEPTLTGSKTALAHQLAQTQLNAAAEEARDIAMELPALKSKLSLHHHLAGAVLTSS